MHTLVGDEEGAEDAAPPYPRGISCTETDTNIEFDRTLPIPVETTIGRRSRSPSTRHVPRWFTFGVLGLVAVPACRDRLTRGDVLGVRNATSINGHAVPGTVVYAGNSLEAQYVRRSLLGERQCSLRQHVDGTTATYDRCDYTVDPREKTVSISFRSETWEGGINGNEMTLTDPRDIVWILVKDE